MDKKTNGEKMKDIIEVLMFDCAKMQSFMKEHNLEMVEVWFSEFDRYVSRMRETLEDCDRCIEYGEEWDQ